MIAVDGDKIKPRNAFMTKLTLMAMQSTNKKQSENEFYKAKNAMVDVLTNICKHRCFAAQIARSTLEKHGQIQKFTKSNYFERKAMRNIG